MHHRSDTLLVFKHIDWITVAIYLIMVVAGIFSIYAASYDFDQASILSSEEFSGKQIRWALLAFALAIVLLLFDSRVYETYAAPTYIVLLVIMAITIVLAKEINGSRSWLVIGPLRFQPAEFGKFATALMLAKLFESYNFKLTASRQNMIKAFTIISVPILLILAQKETGSALAYTALMLVLYREGMSGLVLLAGFCAVLFFVLAIKYTDTMWIGIPAGQAMVFWIIMILMVVLMAIYAKRPNEARTLGTAFLGSALLVGFLRLCSVYIPGYAYFLPAILIGAGYISLTSLRYKSAQLKIIAISSVVAVMFPFTVDYAFNNILQPHQQQRIRVTLHMSDDPLGEGYNVNQSKIAIGSGGFAGKGFLNGTQTKLKYVPEQHTDFIYCTIGEEEGFLGSSAVMILFLILILRIIHISERQPTAFGRVYGYCVASYFLFHLAINTGMVIGLCPVIGIPLPFFSYGGSSLWSFTILLFILLRIDAARRLHHSFR